MNNVIKDLFAKSLTFRVDELPEIADWDVGKEYIIVLKVEQTAIRNKDYFGSKDKVKRADFEIKQVGVIDDEESYEEEYTRRFNGM